MSRRRRAAVQLALLLLLPFDMAITPTTECPPAADMAVSTGATEPLSLVQMLKKAQEAMSTSQSDESSDAAVPWTDSTGAEHSARHYTSAPHASTPTAGTLFTRGGRSTAGSGGGGGGVTSATTRADADAVATRRAAADDGRPTPDQCYPEPSKACGRATLPVAIGAGKDCTAVCDCATGSWAWAQHEAECGSLMETAGVDPRLYKDAAPAAEFDGDAESVVRHPVCGTLTVKKAAGGMCMLACERLPRDMVQYALYSDSPATNDCFGMAG